MSLKDPQKYEQPVQPLELNSAKTTAVWLYNSAAILFYLLPKNLLSWMTGALVRVQWPRPLRQVVNQGFINIFRINMDEAQGQVLSFPTIEAIFTRALKPGAREIQGGFVSPADGFLVRSAALDDGQAIQAKGLDYSVAELVGASPSLKNAAWSFTVYLAPHNYHRVHAPVSGVLKQIGHIPGDLWPVNEPFVARIPRLFNRNERLVFKIEASDGGILWMVMVGAFNVGRMTSPYAPFLVTNCDFGSGASSPRWASLEKTINVGDELGTFMLGSTVILVLDQDFLKARGGEECLVATANKTMVQMGQSLVRGIHD